MKTSRSGHDPAGPAAPRDGPVASTFTVPSYDWDGGSGMDALVSAILSFTPDGCTLMSSGDGAIRHTGAVFFPNATGVRFQNGTRAVVDGSGDIFAIEGREFAYAGGYVVDSESELGCDWAAQCSGPGVREGAIVNDDPVQEPLTTSSVEPDRALPTSLPSDAELGYYDVPTFEWDPEQARDTSRIEGQVSFTDEGCPVVDVDDGESLIGLMVPNAEGPRDPQDAAMVSVHAFLPNGTSGTVARAGERVVFGGGYRDADHEGWTSVCRNSVVERTFQIFDPGFTVG